MSFNEEALKEMRAEMEEMKSRVERMRRSDNSFMAEMKKLIQSEIKAYRKSW